MTKPNNSDPQHEEIQKRLYFVIENNHLIDNVGIEVAEILDLIDRRSELLMVQERLDQLKDLRALAVQYRDMAWGLELDSRIIALERQLTPKEN